MKSRIQTAVEKVQQQLNTLNDHELYQNLSKFFNRVGYQLSYATLLLYFAFKADSTPKWAKRIIIGSFAYLVTPIDFIPDLAPFIGFTDDFDIMLFALVAIACHINKDIRFKAKEKLFSWFATIDEADLEKIDAKL